MKNEMKIHKLNLKTGQYAILAFLFILILSYIGFPRMFFSSDEIIENEEFGEVVDWHKGDGYLVVLTKNPDENVGTFIFEKKIANFYSKVPSFKSKLSNASYENVSVSFKGRNLFIEFGENKEAGSVEVIYSWVYARDMLYENGYFLRVSDDKIDPDYDHYDRPDDPKQKIVYETRLRDENGAAFEMTPVVYMQ